MKTTKKVLRLWRVEWVHRNGYLAPYMFVEAKERKEAVKLLQNSSYRLKDFPESWSWKLLATDKVWSEKQNTWVKEEPSFS